MKRWLRSFSSHDLSPLSLSSSANPISPTTPTTSRRKIEHLGVVGEYNYLGEAGTVSGTSNTSFFNADKVLNEALRFVPGTGNTDLPFFDPTKSLKDDPADEDKKPQQVSSRRDQMDSSKQSKTVSTPRTGQTYPTPEGPIDRSATTHDTTPYSSVAEISHITIQFICAIQSLKDRESTLMQRIKSLRTINQDDERRLNEFLDVLRLSPLTPVSAQNDARKDEEQAKAEKTLTKLERLFVRSSDCLQNAEKELETAKIELSAMRDGLETELARNITTDKHIKTQDLEVPRGNGLNERQVNISKLIEELRKEARDPVLGKEVEVEIQIPIPRNAKLSWSSRPPLALEPRSRKDKPQSPLREALMQAKLRLRTAQAEFDSLAYQYQKDAYEYRETYQSCLKSVTDFDLEHLQRGQQATRELIDAELELRQVKRDVVEENRRNRVSRQGTGNSVERKDEEEDITSEQSSGFMSVPEDGETLDRELREAIQRVDRLRIERWRRHIYPGLPPSLAPTDSDVSEISPQGESSQLHSVPGESDLQSLACGESICGFAEGRKRQRIDSWRARLEEMRWRLFCNTDMLMRSGRSDGGGKYAVMEADRNMSNPGSANGGVSEPTETVYEDDHQVLERGRGQRLAFRACHVDKYPLTSTRPTHHSIESPNPRQRADRSRSVERAWWTSPSTSNNQHNDEVMTTEGEQSEQQRNGPERRRANENRKLPEWI